MEHGIVETVIAHGCHSINWEGTRLTKTILIVDGMSCQHCVHAVTQATEAIAGVSNVFVDLKKKRVSFEHSDDTVIPLVKEAITELDYVVIG
jgi:copper chaperone